MHPTTDILVQAFGLGRLIEPPTRVAEAWSNEVYAATTSTGRYAIKVLAPATHRVIEHAMTVEAAVLAVGAVPMAEPVPDTAGRWLTTLPTGEIARCHRWVDGIPASADPPSIGTARDVGRSVGAIHALGLPGGDTGQLEPPDLGRWRADLKREFRGASAFRRLTSTVLAAARNLESLRAANLPMIYSHRDIDPKNAVIQRDGRVALLDWDYAGPVVAAGELVEAAMSFCDTDQLVAEFVRSYVDAGGPVREIPPLALAAQQADFDWLLRNVERCNSTDPSERELGERLTPRLVAEFEPGVAALDRCARLINRLLRTG